MAVLSAQYKHPQSAYSGGLRNLIDSMLKVNPKDRPDINGVSTFSTLLFLLPARSTVSTGYSDDGSRAPGVSLTDTHASSACTHLINLLAIPLPPPRVASKNQGTNTYRLTGI